MGMIGDQLAAGSGRGRISEREPGLNARCTLPVIRRTGLQVLVCVGLLAVSVATPSAARAAGDIVVSVSPTRVAVGQPVEVLVRTFRVVERSALSLPFESPVEPYPVPSGVWNILYSWPEYPFDVVAQHEDGTEVRLTLARDQADSTIWRGTVSLPKAGMWTIWVRNFQHKEPGSTAVVTAQAGPPASAETVSGAPKTAPALDAGPATLVGALLGVVSGFVIGRVWRRRLPS